MSNVRWACPLEGDGNHGGVNAPSRLRKIDIRRFCIPCSQAKGVLVERVQPKRLTAAAKAAAAKEAAAEARVTARIEENRRALEAKASAPGPLTDLEAMDLLNVVAGVTLHFAPPVARGRWRGVVLTEPGTVVAVKGKVWHVRREGEGDVVVVHVRAADRRGWVSTRPLKMGDWRLSRTDVEGWDVFVSPAAEAPAPVSPRDT